MRPLIGIPLCLDDRGRWRPGREVAYADQAYVRAVARAGGTALHLPIQDDVAGLAERLDGLLVPGGDDFLPEPGDRRYDDGVRFEPVPERQLAFDRALLGEALERGLPVLGLCYGMQLLALHAGGSLHLHLPVDLPGAGEHRLPEPDGRHAVRVEAGTRLADILGAGELRVNSRHHQAVAHAGAGLRVAARAADGVIEAVEGAGGSMAGSFCVGVQWHPETLDDPRLLAAFVAACAARPRKG